MMKDLAERCEQKALAKLEYYFQRDTLDELGWSGFDRVDEAAKLLACAAALRARSGGQS